MTAPLSPRFESITRPEYVSETIDSFLALIKTSLQSDMWQNLHMGDSRLSSNKRSLVKARNRQRLTISIIKCRGNKGDPGISWGVRMRAGHHTVIWGLCLVLNVVGLSGRRASGKLVSWIWKPEKKCELEAMCHYLEDSRISRREGQHYLTIWKG